MHGPLERNQSSLLWIFVPSVHYKHFLMKEKYLV